MNTPVNNVLTECSRCGGAGGAHFAFCFVAQVWERFIGSDFPWAPPVPPKTESDLRCTHDVPLSEPCVDCLPDPGDEWDDGHGFLSGPTLDPYWAEVDPPDPDGAMEDFLVMAGHVQSDADWLPADRPLLSCDVVGPQAEPADAQLHSVEARTHLPEDYYTGKVKRRYNTAGLAEHRRKEEEAREDAVVQFLYDACEFVVGGRVPLNDLHARYVVWQKANGRPHMDRPKLRELIVKLGQEVQPGRMPGARQSGKAPTLVHGITLRTSAPPAPEPEPVPKPERKRRDKHALLGEKPGSELPKQYRELIEPLVTEQGWEYHPCNGNGRGKPRLIKGNVTVTLPNTPNPSSRTLANTRSHLKQNGAVL